MYHLDPCDTIGNKIATQTILLYFVGLWGEESLVFQRASDLLELLSGPSRLPRIKHTYVKPAMFGYETEGEGSRVEWISTKGFIKAVVNRDGGKEEDALPPPPMVEYYKGVVAYLLRDCHDRGAVEKYFDPRYVHPGRFLETFENLYLNADPAYLSLEKVMQDIREKLRQMEEDWKRMVYEDLANQICSRGLLRDASNHFDWDQCQSLAKMTDGSSVFSERQKVDFSSLGPFLKREISKKMDPVKDA